MAPKKHPVGFSGDSPAGDSARNPGSSLPARPRDRKPRTCTLVHAPSLGPDSSNPQSALSPEERTSHRYALLARVLVRLALERQLPSNSPADSTPPT